ncbi:hypothetical protein AB0H63_16390, partial [Micromonospora echinospora]|uniref:hypothetical protein n=1 Tax=Micromonospora echinospora TaxID=1877 RepID=UPI0033DD9224
SGLGLFTAASVVCGLATDQAVLVGARFVQGVPTAPAVRGGYRTPNSRADRWRPAMAMVRADRAASVLVVVRPA